MTVQIDQKTAQYSIPKPHPSNTLDEDVLRLRAALDQIDGLIYLLNQARDGALAIAAGGTGATTAAGALANLGAMANNPFLAAIAALTGSGLIERTSNGEPALVATSEAGRKLLGAASAEAQRTALQLGSIATFSEAAFAPAAKGVNNGNSHDHSGGNGGAIVYTSLTGLPTLGDAASRDVGVGELNVARGNHDHSGLYEQKNAGLWAQPGRATSSSITYDANGRVSVVTEVYPAGTLKRTLTYNDNGQVSKMQTDFNNLRRVESYGYLNNVLTTMSASETVIS